MADEKTDEKPDVIKIGSFEDSHFLLKGVAYLDQLLLGYEPVDCEVIFIECESWVEVNRLWEESDGTMPWAVHPQIVERIKVEAEQRAVNVRRDAQKEALSQFDDDDDGWLDNLKV